MEKYLEYSQDVILGLAERYPECKFNFQLANSSVNISVFFVIANSEILKENDLWQKISEEIAMKYQSKLGSVYEKWNLYIIYVTNDRVPKELKNIIENDKFSSRKIVEDSYSKEINIDGANELIIKHITNTDLKDILAQTQDKIQNEYIPVNAELWKLINDGVLLDRNTDLQREIVEQLIQIKDEN